MKYYSPSTSGFYDSSIHTSIPTDAIEITDEQHKHLIEGQNTTKVIGVVDGNVELIDRVIDQDLAAVERAKRYLRDTDYKMTADYDKDTTEVQQKRAEARAIIRAYEQTQ